MTALVVYLQNTWSRLRDRQEGQTMAEYALILGGIAILVIAGIIILGPAVRDLECEADPRRGRVAHLDAVDHRPLGRVRELERRAAGVEDHHARVPLGLERRLLGEPEGVAVEGEGRVEVLGLHDDAQLDDAVGVRGHAARLEHVLVSG